MALASASACASATCLSPPSVSSINHKSRDNYDDDGDYDDDDYDEADDESDDLDDRSSIDDGQHHHSDYDEQHYDHNYHQQQSDYYQQQNVQKQPHYEQASQSSASPHKHGGNSSSNGNCVAIAGGRSTRPRRTRSTLAQIDDAHHEPIPVPVSKQKPRPNHPITVPKPAKSIAKKKGGRVTGRVSLKQQRRAIYKQRYIKKRSIKRMIRKMVVQTGDKAAVIFLTRNDQRRLGYDIEFFNGTTDDDDTPHAQHGPSTIGTSSRRQAAAAANMGQDFLKRMWHENNLENVLIKYITTNDHSNINGDDVYQPWF